jgi:hypothetical protein
MTAITTIDAADTASVSAAEPAGRSLLSDPPDRKETDMLSSFAQVDGNGALAHVDGGAAARLKRSIEGMLVRNAKLAAADVSIQIWTDGVISLSGTVDSWADHDAVIAAAWAQSGATEVHDHLRVEH